jgi:NhaP-type Na+/H+ or K+/H+ antiporter
VWYFSFTSSKEDATVTGIWRFIFGAAIGGGLGYALVLLAQPAGRTRPRFRTIDQAPAETSEERTAA